MNFKGKMQKMIFHNFDLYLNPNRFNLKIQLAIFFGTLGRTSQL